MKQEHIVVANLSCGGCVNTISKKLSAIKGVEKVTVDLPTNTVWVNSIDSLNRAVLTQALLSMGYPEATAQNGLVTQLKSIGSCIAGKLS